VKRVNACISGEAENASLKKYGQHDLGQVRDSIAK